MKAAIGDCSGCPGKGVEITYRPSIPSRCLCRKCDNERKRVLQNTRQSVYQARKRAKDRLSPPKKPYSFKNKRSSIVRVPVKKKPTKRYVTKQEKDAVLNREIWRDRKHCCYECLRPIEGDGFPTKGVFSHVHGKGARSDLRFLKANVVLHCPTCHQEWETGGKRSERMPNTLKLFEKIGVEYPDDKYKR